MTEGYRGDILLKFRLCIILVSEMVYALTSLFADFTKLVD